MSTARYQFTVTDERTLAPIAGMDIYVYDQATGVAATMTDDLGQPLTNPLVTDTFGVVAFNAVQNLYRADFILDGRLRYKESNIVVGDSDVVLKGAPPAATRAGKFLAYDADGNPVASTGTGADAGLRADLAASTGATLVDAGNFTTPLIDDGLNVKGAMESIGTNLFDATKGFTLIRYKRSETGTYARTAAELQKVGGMDDTGVSLMHWIDPSLDDAILGRTVTGSQAAMIQNALDYAPLNGILTIPAGNFRIGAQLDMERAMSFKAAQGAYFLGVLNDPTKYLLNVKLDATALEEGRRLLFESLYIEQAFGLDCLGAINLEAQTGVNLPQHLIRHWGCKYSVPNASTGYAVRIAGVDSQQHIFYGCEIQNGVHLDGCADANQFFKNWFLGKKACLVDMTLGAFKTEFVENVAVASDGFLYIKNGSQIDILRNQIEQPGINASTYNASIVIRPDSYDSQCIVIEGNNFGGGDVDYSIYMDGSAGGKVRDTRIGVNIWGTTNNADIKLNDANVLYTRIDSCQQLRGERGGATFTVYPTMSANTLDVNALLDVEGSGTGTAGIRLNAVALGGASATALLNSYTCPSTFYFSKDPDSDIVSFNGYFDSPSAAQSDVVFGTLPAGFRPDVDQLVGVTGFDLGTGATVSGLVIVQTGGNVLCTRPASTNSVRLGASPITFRAKREGYQPGY